MMLDLKGLSLVQLKNRLQNGGAVPYEVVGGNNGLAMDTARTDARFEVWGDWLAIATTLGSLEGVTVRFNMPNAQPVPMEYFNPWPQLFFQIFITHPARSGQTLWVIAGRDALPLIDPTATAPKVRFFGANTDETVQFTGAIAQYATEEENLTGLMGNRIRINQIQFQSKERLHYRLIFAVRDTFFNATLASDQFIGEIDLDLTTEGWQIAGANQWYQSIQGLEFDYEDLDETTELHMALQNLSAAAKTAGVNGEVKVNVQYEVRA